MVGVHGDKLIATRDSDKLPAEDVARLDEAIGRYEKWINDLNDVIADTVPELITKMVDLLNEYKNYIELDLIFDDPNDFLYRQKGQLKLDNTIIEEFLPILVKKCIDLNYDECNFEIGSQEPIYSMMYFDSKLNNPGMGGNLKIKQKDQDFSMSRKIYIQSSYTEKFNPDETTTVSTHLGYVLAEIKTNLDKTMFQEACGTAHDVKLAVTGAKYYLLCEYLDMTPISSSTTDIDEVMILRKAKRISSNIRGTYNTYRGRQDGREYYSNFLHDHPCSSEVFQRFVNCIFAQLDDIQLIEEDVLEAGHF